jgi:gluconate 2-dehydrogenase gamma chain
MQTNRPITLSRRYFLASVACLPALSGSGYAHTMKHTLPWSPFAGDPPKPVNPMGWYYLTPAEVTAVEAIVDRLIPGDHLSPGGKDAGCAVFIDRQLAGSFGKSSSLYTKGPFAKGLPTQGYQGELTPSGRYREGLKALDAYVGGANGGKTFAQLTPAQQDSVLDGVSEGKITLKGPAGFSGRQFFELILQNTMEGFFADPLYGGNKDMVSWKMIGFPGARYDYRDYIEKYNQPYPHGPVSIMSGAPGWNVKS